MMLDKISVIEKPDWLTWDDIKKCLYEAHSLNREKGIKMSRYQWPANKMKEYVESNGCMLVAMRDKDIIGTAAIVEKKGNKWYTMGRYASVCFDSVKADYMGQGVFKLLDTKREEMAKKLGLKIIVFDTHANNIHRQEIAIKNGYRYVSYTHPNDHYNVVMAKWLDGCPFSSCYCMFRFYWSKIKLTAYINLSKFKSLILNR